MMITMKVFSAIALFWVSTTAVCSSTSEEDTLISEIKKAQQRLQTDYIYKLWYGANEAITESQDGLLTMYTQYTIQQAQNVIDHINLHQNLTRVECADKRLSAMSTKNLTKVVSTLQCMFANEDNTLKAYKLTGYNLHNCIRMAQNEMERDYLNVIRKLENIKSKTLESYVAHYKSMDNCVQKSCVMSNLFQSIINYEKLQEEVLTNVTEIKTLSTRYIFPHIAMGCVSNSLMQISENYNIGKRLVDECLKRTNDTSVNNSQQEQV